MLIQLSTAPKHLSTFLETTEGCVFFMCDKKENETGIWMLRVLGAEFTQEQCKALTKDDGAIPVPETENKLFWLLETSTFMLPEEPHNWEEILTRFEGLALSKGSQVRVQIPGLMSLAQFKTITGWANAMEDVQQKRRREQEEFAVTMTDYHAKYVRILCSAMMRATKAVFDDPSHKAA